MSLLLEHVCPALGTVTALLMWMAPVRDLRSAMIRHRRRGDDRDREDDGLGELNPTPWAFMLGNCLGWSSYGILTSDPYVFVANYPGFLVSCWLNLGATKLIGGSGENDDENENYANDNDNDNEVREETAERRPRRHHDRIVLGVIVAWSLLLSGIGFYATAARDDDDDDDDSSGAVAVAVTTVVGYAVNLNLIFFYGAPLTSIGRVLRSKTSDSLHVPTMVTNTANSVFWTTYAIFAVNDPFIYVPNGLGIILGILQLILRAVFPRSSSSSRSTSTRTRKASSSVVTATTTTTKTTRRASSSVTTGTVPPSERSIPRDDDDDDDDDVVGVGVVDETSSAAAAVETASA